MVLCFDASHPSLLQEMRAVHTQVVRINDRIRRLEDTSPIGQP